MNSQIPRCTIAGRWFAGTRSGVCRLWGHPRCRIPRLLPGSPAIETAKGWLRPERSLVYDDNRLLLHHAASTHRGSAISAAQLAGFQKTAQRLIAITTPHPWAALLPLEFPQPEEFLFSTGTNSGDALLFDLIQLRGQLQQVESLSLHTIDGSTFLAFLRC